MDEVEGGEVALKFPKPQVAAAATYRAAFVREAWVGARVNSPWVGRDHRTAAGAADLPLHGHAALSGRTSGDAAVARRPLVGLEEGRNIAIKLARGVAALHRAGIIHRDIKPDNVILEGDGSLKLIDLGVVRVPGLEDFPPEDIPGTLAYMAPEMFAGEPGNEATDIYALGVTMFRAFTGEFPYGNLDAISPPRRSRPTPLADLRPDLPAWLQAALGRAIATDPAERFRDVMEFALEMEAGPSRAPAVRAPAADALRAFAVTILARRRRAAGAGAASVAVVALTPDADGQSWRRMRSILALHLLCWRSRPHPSWRKTIQHGRSAFSSPYSPGGISDIAARHCRRQADRSVGSASHRREPARRQWLHRRDGCGTGSAGWLHAGHGHHRRRRHQSGAVQGRAVRRRARSRAGLRRQRRAARARRQWRCAVQVRWPM